MHSVFAQSLNLCKVKDSGSQIHTILFYIAEIYLSEYIGGECTLTYSFAEVYATL